MWMLISCGGRLDFFSLFLLRVASPTQYGWWKRTFRTRCMQTTNKLNSLCFLFKVLCYNSLSHSGMRRIRSSLFIIPLRDNFPLMTQMLLNPVSGRGKKNLLTLAIGLPQTARVNCFFVSRAWVRRVTLSDPPVSLASSAPLVSPLLHWRDAKASKASLWPLGDWEV